MSTRGRLTTTYAVLLLATLVVFGITVSATRDREANNIAAGALPMADTVVTTIRGLQQQLRLNPDSQPLTVSIPDRGTGQPVARATRSLVRALDALPGYFLLFGSQGQLLYVSPGLKALIPDSLPGDQYTVNRVATSLPSRSVDARVTLSGGGHLFMVADTVPSDTVPVPNISRVIVAVPIAFSDLLPSAVSQSVFIVAPLLFLLSVGA